MIKAVLFDMDGVLVNTERFYTQALIETFFEETGIRLTNEEVGKYTGLIYVDKIKGIFKERNLKGDPFALAEKSRERFLRIIRGNIKLLPGAKRLIEELVASGLKLGLVSSSKRKVIELVLKEAGIEGTFDVIIAQEDVKHLKPDPEPYLLASKRLNLEPEECVVIEDSVHGVSSAKAAGMKCIAVINPNAPVSSYSGADFVVNDLKDLNLRIILDL